MTATNREFGHFVPDSRAVIVAALVAGVCSGAVQSNLGIRIGHLVWPVIFSAVVAFWCRRGYGCAPTPGVIFGPLQTS